MYVSIFISNLLALSVIAVATVAHADTTYFLNDSACSSGCSALPAGIIDLKQISVGDVEVTVTLTSDYTFRDAPDNNHHALVFDLSGITGPVTATNISNANFTFSGAGSYKAAGLGSNFEYAFEDSLPNNSSLQSFSFYLKATGLTTSSFTSNGSDYFGVDVKGLDSAAGVGKTGNIGATGPGANGVPPVPEPSSIALLGTGLLACAGAVRKKLGKR